MFTSTPRRSIMPNAFEPLLEDLTPQRNQFFSDFVDSVMQDEKFGVNQEGGSGLFGCQVGSGVKLQKRLSFVGFPIILYFFKLLNC